MIQAAPYILSVALLILSVVLAINWLCTYASDEFKEGFVAGVHFMEILNEERTFPTTEEQKA